MFAWLQEMTKEWSILTASTISGCERDLRPNCLLQFFPLNTERSTNRTETCISYNNRIGPHETPFLSGHKDLHFVSSQLSPIVFPFFFLVSVYHQNMSNVFFVRLFEGHNWDWTHEIKRTIFWKNVAFPLFWQGLPPATLVTVQWELIYIFVP